MHGPTSLWLLLQCYNEVECLGRRDYAGLLVSAERRRAPGGIGEPVAGWPEFASWRHLVAFHGTIGAMRVIEARYEEGLLKPETPLALTPGERVALIVVRHPDPRRWDLERLAKSGAGEDRALAEQGLAEWADALDREDHS